MKNLIAQQFAVYPVDENLCAIWATIMAESRSKGRRLETADAWIAATAIAIGAPLMSHNAKHFAAIPGLRLFGAAM